MKSRTAWRPGTIRRIDGSRGLMASLDPAQPLRNKYEVALTEAQSELAQVRAQAEHSNFAWVLQRPLVEQCTVDLAKLRVERHGILVSLLADKQDAGAFFRPAKAAIEDVESN